MCNFPPPPPFFPNHLTNYLKMWAYDTALSFKIKVET